MTGFCCLSGEVLACRRHLASMLWHVWGLGSGLHVASRDGDKPSKYKTCLLIVVRLLLPNTLSFFEANELQPLLTNKLFLSSLEDVSCKDYHSWDVQWNGRCSQGTQSSGEGSQGPASLVHCTLLFSWGGPCNTLCRTSSVLNLILLIFYCSQRWANRSSAGHWEEQRWFDHKKFSMWCEQVTAQNHLFLINLLNQFGSSKPIPLTG